MSNRCIRESYRRTPEAFVRATEEPVAITFVGSFGSSVVGYASLQNVCLQKCEFQLLQLSRIRFVLPPPKKKKQKTIRFSFFRSFR